MENVHIDPASERLAGVRESLALLHRALLDAERRDLEVETGRLASTEYLQHLMLDPRFAWLRPMGRMVATLDERRHEATKSGTPLDMETVAALCVQVARLVTLGTTLEAGDRYAAWLQRDPHVVLAHAALAQALRTKPTQMAA